MDKNFILCLVVIYLDDRITRLCNLDYKVDT